MCKFYDSATHDLLTMCRPNVRFLAIIFFKLAIIQETLGFPWYTLKRDVSLHLHMILEKRMVLSTYTLFPCTYPTRDLQKRLGLLNDFHYHFSEKLSTNWSFINMLHMGISINLHNGEICNACSRRIVCDALLSSLR